MSTLPDLICPRCNSPLQQIRTSHGVLWTCHGCNGRAVGVELLRRTFTSESINPLWLHAIRSEGQSSCKCPSCRNPMIEVNLSDSAGVRVDVCRLCHFVWFDPHEVDTLVPRPPPPAQLQLPQKARELLAMEEIKRIAQEAEGSDFDSVPPDEWWKTIAGFLGMPIEFDTPSQDRHPWLTWSLCFVIIAVNVFAFPHLREVVEQFGLIPAQATRFGGLTLLTSFFLHGGILHLVGNMYFLLVFGDNVECFLRPLRFAALILFAAVMGDLAHVAANPQSTVPCIGASGGIAGVIVFYALQFPRVRLGFLMRYFFYFRWIRMPAWFALILWILLQLLGAHQQMAGITSVSAFAHLGGAVAGFVAWLMWKKNNEEKA